MSPSLNSGKGRCQASMRLVIKPIMAVIELGAAQDVVNTALQAAHHVNRHGSKDDYIAVALPTLRRRREGMSAGHEIEFYGSENSLTKFLGLDGPEMLVRRGMLVAPELDEVYMDVGTEGTAYIRDRSNEKNTIGWKRRAKARAERRGRPWVDRDSSPSYNASILALHYGSKVVHVKPQTGIVSAEPLMVSTYGYSSSFVDGAAVLPVAAEHSAELAHAV